MFKELSEDDTFRVLSRESWKTIYHELYSILPAKESIPLLGNKEALEEWLRKKGWTYEEFMDEFKSRG